MTSTIPGAFRKSSIWMGVSVPLRHSTRSGRVRLIASIRAAGLGLGLVLASGGMQMAIAADDVAAWSQQGSPVTATTVPGLLLEQRQKRVNFEGESPSHDTRNMADWVVDSGDNSGLPFMIVDKKAAKVYVFHTDGRLRGSASALLGLAVGDDSVPGIGDRKLSTIRPEERTTPAGRFVADLDRNLKGAEILWIDYDSAISLHPVITSNLKEQRAVRLASPSIQDNRISYGCINVPADFFKNVVSTAFSGTKGVVYVLPETRAIEKVFAAYDVDVRARLQSSSPSLPSQAPAQTDANFAVR